MGFLSQFRARKSTTPVDDNLAAELSDQIIALEKNLSDHPNDSDVHKTLMIKYNQALKQFAKQPSYRGQIDELFLKIDALRNQMRRNIK
ncbi:MAG: hypothetical protein CENE_01631 [Candidatus Celerinatantimonas neptuna]|nr:MAG: hypothetical protein CENE_01631 [Candidatus Celerinatantimonas neptuna]